MPEARCWRCPSARVCCSRSAAETRISPARRTSSNGARIFLNDAIGAMNFVLAAGGTGGHMIPAHALAAELKSRGHGVMLITDERGARFPGLFDKVPVHILPAGRLGGGPIGWLKALRSVIAGRGEARGLYRNHTPDAVVGFGGYPAF